MKLHEEIKDKIAKALKSKDKIRLLVLRSLIAAFTNELVAKKKKPDGILDNSDALAVIQKEAKKRKDSIEQFKSGGREDLVKKEEQELKVIEEFLPEMMSEDEIRKHIEAKKSELGIENQSKAGVLIGSVMQELKGKADGIVVKQIVDSLFE